MSLPGTFRVYLNLEDDGRWRADITWPVTSAWAYGRTPTEAFDNVVVVLEQDAHLRKVFSK